MKFGWIKKLFKNKSNINSNSSDISTIDISHIKVPKISDLIKEDQDKVKEYLNEIKYEEYETIVKYSNHLLDKSNKEIDFFIHDLEDSIKNIENIVKKVSELNVFKLLEYREEVKLSIEEFNEIEKEAELRLIALDTYIKKEERRKYDFLGIFGKAERLRYLSDKSSLLNERQRLLITIKINKQHLQMIYNLLNDDKYLLESMNNYIKNNKEITMFNDVYKFIRHMLDKEKILGYDFSTSETFEALSFKNNDSRIFRWYAKENRRIKEYAYEHKNDYEILIKEINELSKKYERTSSRKWSIKELEKTIVESVTKATNYVIICNKYLNDDIIKQLKESLFNLNYFFYISEVRINYGVRRKEYYRLYPMNKLLIDGCYTRDIINNKFLINFKGWKWDCNEEQDYYDNMSLNILDRIENKYDISIGNIKKKKALIESLSEKGRIHFLFDFLNTNQDIYELYFKLQNLTNSDVKIIVVHKNRNQNIIDRRKEKSNIEKYLLRKYELQRVVENAALLMAERNERINKNRTR